MAKYPHSNYSCFFVLIVVIIIIIIIVTVINIFIWNWLFLVRRNSKKWMKFPFEAFAGEQKKYHVFMSSFSMINTSINRNLTTLFCCDDFGLPSWKLDRKSSHNNAPSSVWNFFFFYFLCARRSPHNLHRKQEEISGYSMITYFIQNDLHLPTHTKYRCKSFVRQLWWKTKWKP